MLRTHLNNVWKRRGLTFVVAVPSVQVTPAYPLCPSLLHSFTPPPSPPDSVVLIIVREGISLSWGRVPEDTKLVMRIPIRERRERTQWGGESRIAKGKINEGRGGEGEKERDYQQSPLLPHDWILEYWLSMHIAITGSK